MFPTLENFRIRPPRFHADQNKTLAWIRAAYRATHPNSSTDEDRLVKFTEKFAVKPKHVGHRGYELSDFSHENWDDMQVFRRETLASGPRAQSRFAFYEEASRNVFDALYPSSASPPTDLLHVSCTGYLSPSPAQQLVDRRSWNKDTSVAHLYHMGCYAAVPAIRIACALGYLPSGLVGHRSRRISIAHTEFCSLHFHPGRLDPEQIVIQTLFADGFIAYDVVPHTTSHPGLRLRALSDEIVSSSQKLMQWNLAETGFEMTLSKEVPKRLRACLPDFLQRLSDRAEVPIDVLRTKAIFAAHPGGPQILDTAQEVLGLREDQLEHSRAVLLAHGNMSSATLPHVWKSILEDPGIESESLVVTFGFGPGLTIAGALLEKRK